MSSLQEKPNMQWQGHVPDDIILKILHRLPVTSLMRFTTVAKSWNAWIKSSSFISAHHHQIRKKISCSPLVCMQWHGREYCALIPETTDGVLTEISLPPLSLDMEIVGFAEGLICLRSRSIIYLWNPFIRTLKPIDSVGQFDDPVEKLGFGFTPARVDYMFVRLLTEEGYLTGVEIYSLSLRSWTRIKAPSGILERYKISPLWSKVSSEGCIYWLTCCWDRYTILRFDLDHGKIEEIKIDTKPQGMIGVRNEIMVVDGFLVLLEFGSREENGIRVKGHIYKESESGSSSWTSTTSVDLPMGDTDTIWPRPTTESGRIIFDRMLDGRIFAVDCFCDGEDLSFKLRGLGINVMLWGYLLIPIKETLHLLHKNIY